jgi:tRNA (guanine37-N1)-methyltransferase
MLDIPRVKAVVVERGDGEEQQQQQDQQQQRRLVLLRPGTERSHLPPAALAHLFDGPLSPPAEWVPSHPVPLDYSHATLDQVLRACLPEEEVEEVPSAFECVGGIAHVNLRAAALPYRLLIGEALLDKNPTVDVVVNKVGTIESEFRVFRMEVIAEREPGKRRQLAAGGDGAVAEAAAPPPPTTLPYVPATLETVVTQCGVRFALDFAAVYWNSRLETEHARLVARYFLPGQTVADAMCGVGPFAVPAALLAEGGARVFANDLNPAASKYTAINAKSSRVAERVAVFNVDGRAFIRTVLGGKGELPPGAEPGKGGWPAAVAVAQAEAKGAAAPGPWPPAAEDLGARPPVDHLVLNLPASAVEFLDALSGACDPSPGGPWRRRQGGEGEAEGSALPLPLVHVYTFQKDETEGGVLRRIEQAMSCRLDGSAIEQGGGGSGGGDATASDASDAATLARAASAGVAMHRVRDVAPSKVMLCVTFRVPPEAAFSGQLPASAEEAARVCDEFRRAGEREAERASRELAVFVARQEAAAKAKRDANAKKNGGGVGGGGQAKKARKGGS